MKVIKVHWKKGHMDEFDHVNAFGDMEEFNSQD
jgi:hypothetical protein